MTKQIHQSETWPVIAIRMSADFCDQIERWRKTQSIYMTRSEAIRQLIAATLEQEQNA